jgi:hypothetical protein
VLSALKEKLSSGGTPASCTCDCAPDLQYFGPSSASSAGLFPNPVNGYIVMSFTPRRGYVAVTHGKAPSSPTGAGSGTLGDSIGAAPVSWVSPAFQVRYWSISNYLAESPYPVVEVGQGANAIFGGTPDFLTTLDDGYYTVVSSLPSDKPSPSSLTADDATWIPTSASHPGTPELQILRNMLSQQMLYPEGFTFISPPASPSDIIPSATVQEQMGAYCPQAAQCTVQTFETQGWTGSAWLRVPGDPDGAGVLAQPRPPRRAAQCCQLQSRSLVLLREPLAGTTVQTFPGTLGHFRAWFPQVNPDEPTP